MNKSRGRDLGLSFAGTPGALNAITDVSGVTVGHVTLISGSGSLETGVGPVRTGVTAVLPRGASDQRMAFGSSFAWNGSGEVTGLHWLDERGLVEGPILITNTHSVGTVRDSTVQWMRRHGWQFDWTAPIVGETYDGLLNDINGCHVRAEHADAALDSANAGPVEEGAVGGGTGMMCFEFKGGIGTASRVLNTSDGGYTIGVLVQANFGRRRSLRIGRLESINWLAQDMPYYPDPKLRPADAAYGDSRRDERRGLGRDGSIVVIVATDAPLMPHQLKRLARRPALGVARLGGGDSPTSGDIFIAFSTANANVAELVSGGVEQMLDVLVNGGLAPLFEAAADATEEAIVNALVAAETMEGADGIRVPAFPNDLVRKHLA